MVDFYLVVAFQLVLLSYAQINADSCSTRRRCPAIPVRPVCGTNLKTYRNFCMLRLDKCNGKDVELAYKGVCKSCEEDIRGVIRMAVKSFYKMRRKRNGKYRRSKGSLHGSSCSRQEARVIDPSNQMNCLQWKFTMSDSNSDGVLTGRELYPTLRAVRRHYGDKRCLRRVIRYCDKNKDRKVTMNEWVTCMQSQTDLTKCQTMEETARKKILNGQGHAGGYVPKCTQRGTFAPTQCHNLTGFCWCSTSDGRPIPGTSVRHKQPNCTTIENASCFKSLVTALARMGRSRRSSMYVPRCYDDGTYRPIQCHIRAGYCWCVNKTGQKLPGTSRAMREGRPDCRANNARRTHKGCSESQRKAAVKKYMEEIEKEVKSRDDSSYFMQGIRFLESLTTVTKRERHLLWKFKKTDTNKDSIINKNEMAEIEKQWKAALLPCWSIVSLDCDKNKDGNVTWSAWSYCLGERRSFFPGMMGDKTATGPPEAKVTVCKPMRICLLSCTRGFERDKYGCLICKCRGLYSFFRG